ncbi:hypothetical protein CERSUDRAFT_64544 [Gelatoporia subvermispora B]|uniref:Uncharacterized protein n=1 Tax=Ceriporiopsis subvermispora (strain B) TaxID=914234 RepID=M2RHI8_CERS8|nr:hypothetical protein CERSUDRAFT_64544 [Gelatoporia subvermispora B]
MASQCPPLTLARFLEPSTWALPELLSPHTEEGRSLAGKLGDFDSSLALLHRYRNAMLPIHRLSIDVLHLIFQYLVEEYDSPLNVDFGSNTWNHVAHVSHYWRGVALSSPTLWTQISTRYPQSALACLKRSCDAPITFVIHRRIGTSDELPSEVLSAVLSHVGRLCRVYIPCIMLHNSAGEICEEIAPLLRQPAPMLHTLYVYKISSHEGFQTLPTLFQAATPCLRTLVVCFMRPTLESLAYTQLRKLFIRGRKRDRLMLDTSHLLKILQKCPQLEVLKLFKAGLQASGEDLPRIQLPNLRLVDLARTSASVLVDFVGHIESPKCAMCLSVSPEKCVNTNSYLFGVPNDLEHQHAFRDIKVLHVEFKSDYNSVRLTGATQHAPFEIYASSGEGLDDIPASATHLLRSIAKTFDLASLEEFSIAEGAYSHAFGGLTRSTWVEVLERMPMLQTLHIRSCQDAAFSRGILSALSTPTGVTSRLLCPKLEVLSIADDKHWSSLQCYTLAEERLKRGSPMKRLSLRLPTYEHFEDVEDTDLPVLRKVIESVELDPPNIESPVFPTIAW